MMKNKIISIFLTSIIAAGCAAPGSSVGDLAVGDDSAAIKAGRNRASAQLSRAELEQHRRQRANVSEELALEREKRRDKHSQIRETMGTAAGAAGLIGGIKALF